MRKWAFIIFIILTFIGTIIDLYFNLGHNMKLFDWLTIIPYYLLKYSIIWLTIANVIIAYRVWLLTEKQMNRINKKV